MITKITAALLATSLLVACGSTTTPTVTEPVQTPAQIAAAAKAATDAAAADAAAADAAAAVPKTFNQLEAEFVNLRGLYTTSDYQDPSTLPITPGAVSYQGFSSLTLASPTPVNLLGTSSLTLDLSKTSGFSGTFSDFVDQNDTSVPGTLTIANGSINRAGATGTNEALQGVLGGQLTINNNPASFNGTVGGDIVRPARDIIDGEMAGAMAFGGSTIPFTGRFAAKQ
jgi:hypothetical protein